MKPQTEFSALERLEPALLLTAVALGLALARLPRAAAAAEPALVPTLMVLLAAIFYRVPLARLRAAFGHRRYFLTALALNFLLTPLLAYGLGWLWLRDHPALWLGLVLVLVTPCTDWYLVFTALARGDVALNLALLPWNLLFQLALLPFYLFLLTQALLPVELGLVARSFLLFIAVPFIGAQLLRRVVGAGAERAAVLAQYAALTLLIVAVFAHQGGLLFTQPLVVLRLAPAVILFFLVLSVAAVAAARAGNFSPATRAALMCTAVARNSPLTLSLALVLFPAYPLVALTQVVEPLLELPFLVLLAWWLRRSS